MAPANPIKAPERRIRQSFLTLKSGDGAYLAFIAFYALCCLVTWAVFLRQRPGRLLGV
jgi:MFS transporter, NNP family, nitrate/nitrite transporter